MGAIVIYAMAKNARGNGGKRVPKTKVGSHERFPRVDGREKQRVRERGKEKAREYPYDFAGNKFIRDRLIYRPQV